MQRHWTAETTRVRRGESQPACQQIRDALKFEHTRVTVRVFGAAGSGSVMKCDPGYALRDEWRCDEPALADGGAGAAWGWGAAAAGLDRGWVAGTAGLGRG